jgi:hypothetical protein
MTELHAELKKTLDQLQMLRDEVRLQLHLAGLEAKERWNKLEPKLEEAEHRAAEATESSLDALKQTVGSLRELRESLRKQKEKK